MSRQKSDSRPVRTTVFRGATKVSLDAKGRMAIPTRYRERLSDRCGGQLVVTVDKDHCLLVYPLPDWEELEQKLVRLPSMNKVARRIVRIMVGYATDIDMDANGRILISKELREFASLTKHGMLIGQATSLNCGMKQPGTRSATSGLATRTTAICLPTSNRFLSRALTVS